MVKLEIDSYWLNFPLQPTDFQQLDHEKRFVLVFKGVSLLITFYAGLLLVLAHMINPGLHHIREYLLTDRLLQENSVARLLLAIFLFFLLVTALVMISSETYARTMRPQVARIEQESASPGFITNPIPFLSLDICVVLVFVKQIILRFLFKITVPPWLLLCGLLFAILATNSKAKKHLALRQRQRVDALTIGRGNVVHPSVISVALVPLSEHTIDC